jgi:phosphatidylglycerophosphate synthase
MSARALHLVIDARPRGLRGPLAAEVVLGKSMLDHLLELADELAPPAEPLVVHAREDELGPLSELAARFQKRRVEFVYGPPRADAAVLRTDRFYDLGRLKRGLRRGRSPESAVLWRLDRAETIAKAGEELLRRRSYQPLGKYWAFPLAERLAEWLRPTVIRPNALTLTSAGLMVFSASLVAAGFSAWGAGLAIAISLATALVLDTADGRLARLQGTSSAFGRWLDQVLDELADVALHAAIAWAAFRRDGWPGWMLLGVLYASSKYLFQVQSLLGEELEREMKRDGGSDSARLPEGPLTPALSPQAWRGGMKRDGGSESDRLPGGPLTPALSPQAWRGGMKRDGGSQSDRLPGGPLTPALSPQAGRGGMSARLAAIVRLIGHADVRWHLWIVLAVFGRLDLALVAYAFYFALRAIGGGVRKAVRYA